MSIRDREALVVVSTDLLRFPYHIRYELLEFAVYTLAARAQRLVPLHAACIGVGGQGVLLLGPSGAGKSTLALLCLLKGFDFLAEDSVLVAPKGLLATGLSNFLHIRSDSLHLLASNSGAPAAIRRSPLIRRRSGVEKMEIDLRRAQFRLAPAPQRLAAVLFLSAQNSRSPTLLTPLCSGDLLKKLAACQQYAANQPGWSMFTKEVARLPAFELQRGNDPRDSVEAVRQLLLQTSALTPARRRGKQ